LFETFLPKTYFLLSNTLYCIADGDDGMRNGSCPKRNESPAMSERSRSLIVQNYFPTNPNLVIACQHNSAGLFNMLNSCFIASGKRWSNYIAVDFYKVQHIIFSCRCNNKMWKVMYVKFSCKTPSKHLFFKYNIVILKHECKIIRDSIYAPLHYHNKRHFKSKKRMLWQLKKWRTLYLLNVKFQWN